MQHGWNDRFGQIVVSAGVKAALAVAFERMGGDRDDRQVSAGPAFPFADRHNRIAAAHLRHLHVHQHKIERRGVEGVERELAVFGERDDMARFRQQPHRDPLIHDVVFGEQDAKRGSTRCLDGSDFLLWRTP